jgi:hypothetical protein
MNRRAFASLFAAILHPWTCAWAADQKIAIRFQAMVGAEKFACG